MPLHKTWRDLRSRFLFILIALVIATTFGVCFFYKAQPGASVQEAALRTFRGPLFLFWCIAATFLGLGGLLREKSAGTSDYTLSLPISRTRWFWYRACMGGFLSFLVAVIPAAIVPVVAIVLGKQYPLSDALLHGIRLGLGGMLFYAIGLALSCILSGEYATAGIAVASVFVVDLGPKLMRWFNIQDAILPMSLTDKAARAMHESLQWNEIALSLLVSLILALIAWKITLRRDF